MGMTMGMTVSERGKMEGINLHEKLALFTEQWSPRVVSEFNESQLKLTKLEGDFVWHSHPDTDEVFLVIGGELELHFRDRVVLLKPGELLTVPRNVEHKPRAERECHILLIEASGVVNTGDAGGARTALNDVWV